MWFIRTAPLTIVMLCLPLAAFLDDSTDSAGRWSMFWLGLLVGVFWTAVRERVLADERREKRLR